MAFDKNSSNVETTSDGKDEYNWTRIFKFLEICFLETEKRNYPLVNIYMNTDKRARTNIFKKKLSKTLFSILK